MELIFGGKYDIINIYRNKVKYMNYNSFNIAPPRKRNEIRGFQGLAFTRLVKTFRSDSSRAELTQLPAQSSQTKFRSIAAHSYGFTLAETMIVLIVLGVIAAITIPGLVRRQIEAANRAKIKKSMKVYDYLFNKIVTENNIKSNPELEFFAPIGDCTKTATYFKSVENKDGDICRFKTSDGVWWDISDILNPTISLNKDDLDNPNSKNTFKLLGHFGKAGELRVDDLQYELTNEELTEDQLEKLEELYAFINNNKEETETPHSFLDNCDKVDDDNYNCSGTIFKKTTFTTTTYDGSGCYAGTETCNYLKTNSTAQEGEYWTANIGGNISWNDAPAACAAKGASVANVAQLQQMKKAGTLKCSNGSVTCLFWASEEKVNGSGGVFFNVSDGVNHLGTAGSYREWQVLCVGK